MPEKNHQAKSGKSYLNLKVIKGKRWAEKKTGFPVIAIRKYKSMAMEKLIPVVEIREKGRLMTGEIQERLPFQMYVPLTA